MKNNQTYQVDHSTITEITIGEKFELNNGKIVTFVEYNENKEHFPFTMKFEQPILDNGSYNNNFRGYNINLKFYFSEIINPLDIKCKYIPLKDKLNLI